MKVIITFYCLLISFQVFAQKPQYIRIDTIYQGAISVPVSVRLNTAADTGRQYELVNERDGKKIPTQLSNSHSLVFMSEPITNGRKIKQYRLQETKTRYPEIVSFLQTDSAIVAYVNKRPVFKYHVQETMPPADSPAYYKRSGFIHPLYSPSGAILTDGFPEGHTHQHGIFNAWVNTTYKNSKIDFWNQHHQTGTVKHAKVLSLKGGAVYGEMKLLLHHHSFLHGAILAETWTIRIYASGSKEFVFDLESVQENITNDTLHLNKYIYGGMAFRGSREWNSDDKKHFSQKWEVLTNTGKRNDAANHTKANWVSISGKTSGGISGATVFGHPGNFRSPQPIRVHPTMPYWCFSPVVEEGFSMVKGKPLRSRFRYYVHDGKPDRNRITTFENAFDFKTLKVLPQ